IDEIISAHLKKSWTIQRLATVDRNVLRLSIYEIKFAENEIPKGIIINEAVEIAKKYGTDDSGRFVNGILAAIAN
ncbi:MAG: transcription antitermination factor NusB, partial [Selenomonadaceae bacterium]|nr:transcription antitermination factor NusB [Selenomonadaceae bacterium]